MLRNFGLCAATLLFALPALGDTPPAHVDAARLTAADKDATDWMTIGRTYGDVRFSPLDKINADNAGKLGLAWYHDLETRQGQEATPLVVDGVMYISTAWSIVKAFDAKSGKILWTYDPKVPREVLAKLCCDAVSRGVAVWDGKVYIGTLDGRLEALDAATGKPVWSVVTVDQTKPYSISSAPLVVKGRVIVGNSGSEYGVRGYISAYDAKTGKKDWRFYTVPGDPSKPFETAQLAKAAKTWHGKWWVGGGGGTVWGGISYDPALDLIYFGVGNGSEWDQSHRSPGGGDNLYLSSIVALNADTGTYAWHYQTTPGEEWDYDATQNVILTDLTIDGTPRKVLLQANKNGFFYVLDRQTGELISAKEFVPITWATGIDMKTGRPIENPEARYDKTGKVAVVMPGPGGGHNWQPMSFSPKTELVYIPAQVGGFPYLHDKDYKPSPIGFNLGLDVATVSMPADTKIRHSALEGSKGYLLAWDPVNQKEAWRADYKGPWNGGTVATAGNLVFEGDAAGNFAAFRADNGTKLWTTFAQTAVMGAPMTYEVDGEQYVAVMAGWGGAFAISSGIVASKSGNLHNFSRLLVYKLGATGTLPPMPPDPKMVLDPPPVTADAATIQTGKVLFAHYCGFCHGDAAISGKITPDLRYTALLKDDGFFDVVLGGALKDEGMVSFASVIDHDQAAAIRAYIIKRANEDKALEEAEASAPAAPTKQ